MNTGPSKNGNVKLIMLICTRAFCPFLSFADCHAASTIIPLLPYATFTPANVLADNNLNHRLKTASK